MISSHLGIPAGLNLVPTRQMGRVKNSESPEQSTSTPASDALSLSSTADVKETGPSKQFTAVNGRALGESGLKTALNALPPGGASAQHLLQGEVAPMTPFQRENLIQDLSTLDLTGSLQVFDVLNMAHVPCSAKEAFAAFSQGDPIFFDEGRDKPLTKIANLDKLSEVARLAQQGIVG